MELLQARMSALAGGDAIYFRLIALDSGGYNIDLFHYRRGDQHWRTFPPGQYEAAVAECEELNRELADSKRKSPPLSPTPH